MTRFIYQVEVSGDKFRCSANLEEVPQNEMRLTDLKKVTSDQFFFIFDRQIGTLIECIKARFPCLAMFVPKIK